MALLSPAQIREELDYRATLDSIKQSYSATKVMTTLQKEAAAGSEPATYYNVDEYLQLIKEAYEAPENEIVSDAELAAIFQDS